MDKFNKSKFVLKVGQRLNMDGGVDESYPVVIIKKKITIFITHNT